MFYPARTKTGFTLIELLIVISIIAILAAVGLVVYSQAQKQGRISKRIQDLKAISAALEVYHTANGTYPNTNGTFRSECNGTANNQVVIDTVTATNPPLVPNYMPALPRDPSFTVGSTTNCYNYTSNGTDYKITILNGSDMSASDYSKQPQLIDPRWSGSQNPCTNGSSNGQPGAWAIWTQNGPIWNGGAGYTCQ